MCQPSDLLHCGSNYPSENSGYIGPLRVMVQINVHDFWLMHQHNNNTIKYFVLYGK